MSNRANKVEDAITKVMTEPYRREIVPNADGTWFARVPEFPGCITEGDSADEALANLNDAMRAWVRVQIEDGDAIPQPSANVPYSGKFMVRLSTRLHREAAECASREGTSLNAFVAAALARAVGDRIDAVNRFPHDLRDLRNAGISFMLDSTAIHAQTVASAPASFPNVIGFRGNTTAQFEQSRAAQIVASGKH